MALARKTVVEREKEVLSGGTPIPIGSRCILPIVLVQRCSKSPESLNEADFVALTSPEKKSNFRILSRPDRPRLVRARFAAQHIGNEFLGRPNAVC